MNLARDDGVSAEVLRAVVDDAPERLSAELGDAWQFADALCRADRSEAPWRDALRARHGDEVLAELSLAVATARVFPTVERGMGHAASQSLVTIELGSADVTATR